MALRRSGVREILDRLMKERATEAEKKSLAEEHAEEDSEEDFFPADTVHPERLRDDSWKRTHDLCQINYRNLTWRHPNLKALHSLSRGKFVFERSRTRREVAREKRFTIEDTSS